MRERKEDAVAQPWQEPAVGLVLWREDPRKKLVAAHVPAAGLRVENQRVLPIRVAQRKGEGQGIQKRHVRALSKLGAGPVRGVADDRDTGKIGAA